MCHEHGFIICACVNWNYNYWIRPVFIWIQHWIQCTNHRSSSYMLLAWWRHQMETFSALLSLCAWNSPVTREFPSQRPVTRSFDVFLICALNKQLSKQSWGWWFETPSRSLWSHCNGLEEYIQFIIYDWRSATSVQCAPVTWRGWSLKTLLSQIFNVMEGRNMYRLRALLCFVVVWFWWILSIFWGLLPWLWDCTSDSEVNEWNESTEKVFCDIESNFTRSGPLNEILDT